MKKRNWVISSILAASIVTMGAAHACGGPGGHNRGGYSGGFSSGFSGNKMMHVMKRLDLTKEQRKAIRKIKNEQRDQMEDKRDEMIDIKMALHDLVSAETYNAKKVRELADAKSKLMADMTVQRIETMSRIRKQLTAEQLEELDSIKARRFGPGGL